MLGGCRRTGSRAVAERPPGEWIAAAETASHHFGACFMEDHEEMMGSQLDDEKAQRRFNEIIERIEQVRGYLGLNRSKFCRTIGMSPQTYNNFIGPQGTKPNIQLLHGVVTRFGVNPMWLFTGAGNMFLAGYGDKPSLRSIAMRGVMEAPTMSAPAFAEEH